MNQRQKNSMPNIHMKIRLLMMFRYLIITTPGLKKSKGGLKRYGVDKVLNST